MSKEKEWLRKIKEALPVREVTEGTVKETTKGDIAVGNDVLDQKRKKLMRKGFDAVAGMDSLKSMIRESFINVLMNPTLAEKYGIGVPNLLLYGPAGCGKTYFAERMAEEAGVNFMKICPDDLSSIYIHGTQQKIGELFRKAEQMAPTILFFDEFDCMVPQRSADANRQYQTDEVDEFLTMLDGSSKRGVYVVAATNRPGQIDSCIMRTGRMDEKIYIPMPDRDMRASLFRFELLTRPKEGNVDYEVLADLSNGYNCSDIRYIVGRAARKRFNMAITSSAKELITQEDLEDAIAQTPPSVSETDIRAFERMKTELAPRRGERAVARIGFV